MNALQQTRRRATGLRNNRLRPASTLGADARTTCLARRINLFFERDYEGIPRKKEKHLQSNANRMKNLLIYKNSVMPTGTLAFCLEFNHDKYPAGGIFAAIHRHFSRFRTTQLPERIDHIRQVRNTFVAHEEEQLLDPEQARTELHNWISGLAALGRRAGSRDRPLPNGQVPTNPPSAPG